MAGLWGLLLAAGHGERLGAGRPKGMLPVGGRPLWRYGYDMLLSAGASGVLVVYPPDTPWAEDAWGVPGGPSRRESAWRGLLALAQRQPEWVAIHDAARPLATAQLTVRVWAAARRWQAAIPALGCDDAAKLVDEQGLVTATLPRAAVRLVQTPQVFSWAVIWQSLELAQQNGWQVADDAEAVQRAGHLVAVVPGEPANRKLTTPADWEWLQPAPREAG